MNNITFLIYSIYNNITHKLNILIPDIGIAIVILLVGLLVARIVYVLSMYCFEKFKIQELLNRFQVKPDQEEEQSLLPEKIEIDKIVSKSLAYYVIILFFRLSIDHLGITEVEQFITDIIHYLPSLFIGIIIGFFGIRIASFVYNITYHALKIAKQKTSKIIAMGAKIIVLFFTLLIVLDYIKIVNDLIFNTILIGFISMLALAGGLAFGLWGRDIAKEILESFRK